MDRPLGSARRYAAALLSLAGEGAAAEAVAASSRAVPRGQIRVNAPVTFGAYELARVLPGYLAAYPEVDVTLKIGRASCRERV